MRIWLNLEKVKFRTTFRPESEFGVHEVERFRNALKLLGHKANWDTNHISDLLWDLVSFCIPKASFVAFYCIPLWTPAYLNLNRKWIRITYKLVFHYLMPFRAFYENLVEF